MTFNNDPSKRPYGTPEWLGAQNAPQQPNQTEAMPQPSFGQAGYGTTSGGSFDQSSSPYNSPYNRPAGQSTSRPTPPAEQKRSKLPVIFGSVLVLVLVLLVAAEFGTRWVISDSVKQAMVEAAADEGVDASKDDAQVSFGRSSVLLGFAQGKLGTVNVKTPSTLRQSTDDQGNPKMAGTPKMDIRIKDFDLKSLDDPRFGVLDVDLMMSDQNLLDMMQTSAAQSNTGGAAGKLIQVTGVKSNAAQSTVDVQLTGGLATITFKPTVADGKLQMNVENVDVVGISLGDEVAKALGDQFSQNTEDLNNGMEFTGVKVQDGQLEVSLHGTDILLSQLEN